MTKANPFNANCPSQDILALIGAKWSMLLMCILRDGPTRPGELARRAGGISQKMLTQTLRELERHGIVARHDHGTFLPGWSIRSRRSANRWPGSCGRSRTGWRQTTRG